MSRIESIEKQIESLSPEELAAFRKWFLQFDAAVWDQQIESDVQSGRLDEFAADAERAHKSGKTTEL